MMASTDQWIELTPDNRDRPLLAQSGRLHIGRYLTAIDGAKRTLQSLRPSFSVGWNLLAARYSH
jgi:hypothetical protein